MYHSPSFSLQWILTMLCLFTLFVSYLVSLALKLFIYFHCISCRNYATQIPWIWFWLSKLEFEVLGLSFSTNIALLFYQTWLTCSFSSWLQIYYGTGSSSKHYSYIMEMVITNGSLSWVALRTGEGQSDLIPVMKEREGCSWRGKGKNVQVLIKIGFESLDIMSRCFLVLLSKRQC